MIYELVMQGQYFGQQTINRFHYVMTGTPAVVSGSFALMSGSGFLETTGSPPAFPSNSLANDIRVRLSTSFEFVATYVRALYSVTDFYERPYLTRPTGAETGQGLSPTSAYGFFSSRTRLDVRRGFKRFAGVSESQSGAGGVIESSFLSQLEDIAANLSATISYDDEGNTISFAPCVLGLEKYTTPSGKTAYRPYSTLSAQLNHIATGIVYAPYPNVRSQTSRQYKRGS